MERGLQGRNRHHYARPPEATRASAEPQPAARAAGTGQRLLRAHTPGTGGRETGGREGARSAAEGRTAKGRRRTFGNGKVPE